MYKDVSIIHDIDNLYLNQMLSHDLVLVELWRGERRVSEQHSQISPPAPALTVTIQTDNSVHSPPISPLYPARPSFPDI